MPRSRRPDPLPPDLEAVFIDALATALVNDMEADLSDEICEVQEVKKDRCSRPTHSTAGSRMRKSGRTRPPGASPASVSTGSPTRSGRAGGGIPRTYSASI